MMHSRARRRRPDRQVNFLRLLSQHFGGRARDRRIKLHLIKSVAVSFEQFDLLTVQSQHMVTIRRSISRRWTLLLPHKIGNGCLRPREHWRDTGVSRIAARNQLSLALRFSTQLPDASRVSFT